MFTSLQVKETTYVLESFLCILKRLSISSRCYRERKRHKLNFKRYFIIDRNPSPPSKSALKGLTSISNYRHKPKLLMFHPSYEFARGCLRIHVYVLRSLKSAICDQPQFSDFSADIFKFYFIFFFYLNSQLVHHQKFEGY